MIRLFDSQSRKLFSFTSFNDVMEYFNHIEKMRIIAPNSRYGHEKWSFIYYPHRRLSAVNEQGSAHCSEIEFEAYERRLDLIEVYSGYLEVPDQYIVTPDLDVDDLIKNWCFDYAYAHDCVLLQTIYGSFDKEDQRYRGV